MNYGMKDAQYQRPETTFPGQKIRKLKNLALGGPALPRKSTAGSPLKTIRHLKLMAE